MGSSDPSLNGPATSKLAVGSTAAEVDAKPPVVEDVTVTYKSDRQAIITWKTDEPGSSTVEYGIGGELSLVRSTPDPVTEHSVVLTNLSADVSYLFRAGSLDLSNNGPTWSSTEVFDTDPTPDTKAPEIPEDPEVSAITDRTATMKWTTDEVSDSGVKFGTSASSLDFNIGSSEVVMDHREVLTGLEPGTTYFLQVNSTDRSGNGPTFGPAQGKTISFTTEAAPDMIAPAQVANLIGRVGSRTIFLRWTAGSEQDLEGYNLYRASGEDPLALIASNLAEARFMNEGLIDEVVYRYSVTAFDGSGNEGERSAEVLLTPSEGNAPSAPVFRTIRGDVLMPTFVVENASGAEGRDLSYTFQVSVREDFADVVAAAAGIMEGNESEEGGLTAWTIPRELTEGATYFLRVRANDGFDGPFMPVHRFLASDVALARELRPGDFDGSFKVDFEDFFLFAAAFGQSGTGENAVFDLSVDNKIDFEDFFVFASVFGKQYDPPGGATKPLAFVQPLDPTLRVRLSAVGDFPSIGEEFTASIDLEGLPDLRGYGIRIEFDSEQLELLHVEQQENGLAKVIRPDINEAVILNYGEGIVSEAEESEGAEGEASEETNLADLRFRVKVSSLEPHAEVSEMVFAGFRGRDADTRRPFVRKTVPASESGPPEA